MHLPSNQPQSELLEGELCQFPQGNSPTPGTLWGVGSQRRGGLAPSLGSFLHLVQFDAF